MYMLQSSSSCCVCVMCVCVCVCASRSTQIGLAPKHTARDVRSFISSNGTKKHHPMWFTRSTYPIERDMLT